jgi:hypothetical protein
MNRYTTLLDDPIDTSFSPEPVLLGFLVRIPSATQEHTREYSTTSREYFSEGITTSGVTVGNSTTDGFLQFLPSSPTADVYTLQNVNGVLSLLRNESTSLGNVSSTGVTLSSLQKTADASDTTELVPILVDQNGKLYRGHSLFQTIAQLQSRIQTLEQAGSIQVEQRLSQAELLIQRIRNRYNALHIDSTAI